MVGNFSPATPTGRDRLTSLRPNVSRDSFHQQAGSLTHYGYRVSNFLHGERAAEDR